MRDHKKGFDWINEKIDQIMMKDGPDGHTDGSHLITQFILSLLQGTEDAWIKEYENPTPVHKLTEKEHAKLDNVLAKYGSKYRFRDELQIVLSINFDFPMYGETIEIINPVEIPKDGDCFSCIWQLYLKDKRCLDTILDLEDKTVFKVKRSGIDYDKKKVTINMTLYTSESYWYMMETKKPK
jgi:hypothetical protein